MKLTLSTPLRFVVACVFLVGAAGCFEVNQTIKIKKNMSGTAAFDFKMDLEPMVYMMAMMQKMMTGGGQNPTVTKAELARARKEFLAGQGDELKDQIGSRKEFESKLPEGVTLKKFRSRNRGTKLGVNALFAFDNVNKLNDVDMGDSEESPIGGLEVQETADTLTVSTTIDNPTKTAGAAMGGPMGQGSGSLDDVPPPLRKALNRMKFNVVIDAPFEVIEHNATRKQGKKLTWVVDFAALQAAEKTGTPLNVRVVYKK